MANTISVNVIADVKNIKGGIDDVNNKLTGFQSGLGKVGGVLKGAFAGAAVLGGFSALKSGITDVISEAREAEKIGALTANTIASMGNAAGISVKGVEDLSSSLSNKVGIDDDLIQSGANLVLTFGNIKNAAGEGNDIFSQTVGLATDMSVALGQDMKSSSLQLGKALNDPIKGLTALGKAGVSFTADQKEQIKTLQESGDLLGAQKIILGEVQKQFGGAAEATATPFQKLQVMIGNLKESIGTALLPIIDRAATYIGQNLPMWIEKGKAAFEGLKNAFTTIQPILELVIGAFTRVGGFLLSNVPLVIALGAAFVGLNLIMAAHAIAMGVTAAGGLAAYLAQSKLVQAATKAWAAVQWVLNAAMSANPIALVILAIVALIAIFVLAWQNSETFRDIVIGAWEAIKGATSAVWEFIKNLLSGIWDWIKSAGSTTFEAVQKVVTTVWDAVKGATETVWNAIKGFLSGVWDAIKAVIQTAVDIIKAVVTTYFNAYKTLIEGVWNAIKAVTSTVWDAIKGAIKAVTDWIGGAATAVFNTFSGLVSGVWNGIKGATDTAWEGIKTAASNGVTGVVGFIRGLPGQALSALGNVGSTLYSAGRDLLQGMINGLKSMATSLANAALAPVKAAVNAVKGFLGIRSPSRLFKTIGEQTNAGLVNGLKDIAGVKKAAGNMANAVTNGFGTPELAVGGFGPGSGGGANAPVVYVTVNAPVGSSAVDIGRELDSYLQAYTRFGGRRLAG